MKPVSPAQTNVVLFVRLTHISDPDLTVYTSMMLLKLFFVVSIGVCSSNFIRDIKDEVLDIEDEVSEVVDNLENAFQPQPNLQSLSAFHRFMTLHNKSYVSRDEYKNRYKIFRNNMKIVQKLQVNYK